MWMNVILTVVNLLCRVDDGGWGDDTSASTVTGGSDTSFRVQGMITRLEILDLKKLIYSPNPKI